jgi:alkane 1-monooxygenase
MALTQKKWGFFLPYSLLLFFAAGWIWHGYWVWSVPVFVFGAIPLFDAVLGGDATNPNDAQVKSLANAFFYKGLTLFWVPIQLSLMVYVLYALPRMGLESWEFWGMVVSLGIITGGVGITVAHELGHKTNKLEQRAAQILLTSVAYGHFFIEHNWGHHAKVATPEDPASARLGESVFRFLPRTLWGSLLDAWRLEVKRLMKKQGTFWHWRNRMFQYALSTLGWMGLAWWLSRSTGVWIFIVQAMVAVLLLEVVNYIEHYGLTRQKTARGGYEKVDITHSWNANHLFTNLFLFHLQRHSDHHANANRRYQTLRHFDMSPQLPTGYAGMILLALVPPLWFRVMNPKVNAYYRQG